MLPRNSLLRCLKSYFIGSSIKGKKGRGLDKLWSFTSPWALLTKPLRCGRGSCRVLLITRVSFIYSQVFCKRFWHALRKAHGQVWLVFIPCCIWVVFQVCLSCIDELCSELHQLSNLIKTLISLASAIPLVLFHREAKWIFILYRFISFNM